MIDDFRLSAGEKAHPLWARLKAHMQGRLADARVRNDSPSMDEISTAVLRGRIACLKELIRLDDDTLIIE